ncbi:MAG TPA: SAM-dependent methyltransferase [Gemmatimonadales bacterium]|nr:SAM-dependent methyltransferase [Gemmatimonadales bacterium]
MREGHASRTAEQNALFRALESSRPPHQRVCDDPLARHFLRWPYALVMGTVAIPGVATLVCSYIDRRWPGVRSSVVARTRLIDDWIGAAVDHDIEQVVILGAGFDSRAYRLSRLAAIDIFEVDHPDTQAAKQDALKRVLSSAPKHVRFVPVDFKQNDLASAMKNAGYCESKRTLVLWEGVTNYLTADAVDSTLRWCSNASAGSRLVFTYVHRDILTRPSAFVGSQNLFASLERAGERFTFGMEPSQVPEYLAGRGFSLELDIGAAEYRAIYYGARARAMRGHEFYRVGLARVERRAA